MSMFGDFWVFCFFVTMFLAASISRTAASSNKDNPNLQAAYVMDYEKDIIVNLHNKLRANVKPPANDMVKMVWDDKLAKIAETWAKQCAPHNDYVYRAVGEYQVTVSQNVVAGKHYWEEAIMTWYNESKKFVYGQPPASYPLPEGMDAVLRYARMVVAKTSRIGCGFAVCSGTRYFVCNYAPSVGPSLLYAPYTAKWGRNCAFCHRKCKDGLCDCGGKLCRNGGTLNLRDCSCRCAGAIFSGESCEKVTCPKTDGRFCWYRDTGCHRAYVLATCPHMCGLCGDSELAKQPPTHVSPIGCEYNGRPFSKEICSRLGDKGKDKPGCLSKAGNIVTCMECVNNNNKQDDCPVSCGICNNCGGKQCENGGKLHTKDCTCACKENYSGDKCETFNCPDKDDTFCWYFYKKSDCEHNSNTRYKCPYMCGVCGGPEPATPPPKVVSPFNCTYTGFQETEEKCARRGDHGMDYSWACKSTNGNYGCSDCLGRAGVATRMCPVMCGVCKPPCNGMKCENGGTLDPKECKCRCTKLYKGDACEQVNCPKKDPWDCGHGIGWSKESCHFDQYKEVREMCPYMCGICTK